jgi:hypothetical protein
MKDYTQGLNEGQLEAFAALEEFSQSNDMLICLQGYAGTGKTYVITRFIEHYTKKKDKKVCLTAPTNKAVGVLRGHSSKELSKLVDYATIHKLLGVKSKIKGDIEVFEQNEYDISITNYDLVVIDETSMLNDELFEALLKAITRDAVKNTNNMRFDNPRRVKIIFMGDPKQIPPIGKIDCEPFLNPDLYNIKTLRLSQIMRQKDGSNIIELSYHIRENIEVAKIPYQKYHGNDLFVVNAREQPEKELLMAKIKEDFSSEALKEDPHSMKVVAWRNSQVQVWNNLCRSHYHGLDTLDLPQLIIGDTLITNSPVFEGEDIILDNNTELTVLEFKSASIVPARKYFPLNDVKVYETKVEYFDYDAERKVKETILIPKDESSEDLKRVLDLVSNKAKQASANERARIWKLFFHIKNQFANVSHGFAITAHKAQGSTYAKTYVDTTDISRNSNIVERNRILYTAITRASKECIIVGRF